MPKIRSRRTKMRRRSTNMRRRRSTKNRRRSSRRVRRRSTQMRRRSTRRVRRRSTHMRRRRMKGGVGPGVEEPARQYGTVSEWNGINGSIDMTSGLNVKFGLTDIVSGNKLEVGSQCRFTLERIMGNAVYYARNITLLDD